jgi:HK97 family phage portal protein
MSLISLNLEYDPAPDEKRTNPLEDPSIPLGSPAVWSWLSGGEPTASGEMVNEVTALQTISVYACVRVLAESIASLPCKLLERLKSGRSEAVDEDLYYLLTVQPNSEMSAFTFWETLIGCLALTGNCYADIIRDRAGRPAELFPLNPLKTTAFRTTRNVLAYKTTDGMANGAERVIASPDVLHMPLFSFDGLKGFNPIHMARQSVGLTRAAEKFGARFFGNGSRPGGVLTLKEARSLDVKQMTQVRDQWSNVQGGVNQGRTAVLPGDWNYQQIGLSPEDSQFLLTRKFQREDIAALFRVPPHMIGDTSRLSNSNHEQQSLQFVTDTLRPYICRAEQEVTRKLLPTRGRTAGKFFIEFDIRERLRGDFQTTMNGLALGRQWGFLTANMALEEIGQNPVGKEGDVLLYPLNMGNATDLLNPPSERQSSGSQGVQGRNMRRFISSYLRLFRDGVGRVCARNKRDFAAIEGVFKPTLESICETLVDSAREEFSLEQTWTLDCSSVIRAQLKKMEGRANAWANDKADEITGQELARALRAISFHVYREAGASRAPAQSGEATSRTAPAGSGDAALPASAPAVGDAALPEDTSDSEDIHE